MYTAFNQVVKQRKIMSVWGALGSAFIVSACAFTLYGIQNAIPLSPFHPIPLSVLAFSAIWTVVGLKYTNACANRTCT